MTLNFLLTGCSSASSNTLGDLSRMNAVQRVYLQEDGKAVPFLLLEEREGACLMLREHVVSGVPFAYDSSTDSYYAESALDEYLNGEYFQSLDKRVQAKILPSDVIIYARSSIGTSGDEIESIRRGVFALSWTETTGMRGVQEGKFISVLKDRSLLAATTDEGEIETWWLRTPDTWYWHTVLGINEEGGICRLTTQDGFGIRTGGVRPALYLSADTPVMLCDGGWQLLP